MKVKELFDISYGNSFALCDLQYDPEGINFISRTSKNNGVSSKVKKLSKIEPFDPGLITVAVSGSVMESFVQTNSFYTGYHIMILKPKKKMNIKDKIFYCMCLRRNRYKYSYGRQANSTLNDIDLPDKIPVWVKQFNVPDFEKLKSKHTEKKTSLGNKKWDDFSYDDIFDIERGYYNKRPDKNGDLNFISASRENNSVTDSVDRDIAEKIYDGNCITVINNGESTAYASYQKNEFTCSHDINILRLKEKKLNVYIAMFLIPIFKKEKYRFNYGRKWRYERMIKSSLKLPVESNKPDWEFMENYIKSLSFSKYISS